MRRVAVLFLVLAGVLAAPAAAQSPSYQKDSATDGRGKLDLVRVALGPRNDGTLRGELTMEKAWTAADLREGSGPSGSICLQLYTKRVPGRTRPTSSSAPPRRPRARSCAGACCATAPTGSRGRSRPPP